LKRLLRKNAFKCILLVAIERDCMMGKTDTITKEYMENPVVFADAFNQFLYHGNQKIDPARLTELDTTGIVIP